MSPDQIPAQRERQSGWITHVDLRQPAGISHEVAYANALDAAQVLMAAGYDITLSPTMPDVPVGLRSAGWDDADV